MTSRRVGRDNSKAGASIKQPGTKKRRKNLKIECGKREVCSVTWHPEKHFFLDVGLLFMKFIRTRLELIDKLIKLKKI